MQIDGHTRLAAVVANPIKHSISPFIHNSAFEKTQVNGVLCGLGDSRIRPSRDS